ncbi:unnamed protein product, partial [Mesorhabditis belari]|uniref:Neurotransmitter-gated ion-channel ligand-binding domain-containing protein n=1 Tax=Mesorhabditis belari TaxID=2138241 RepID=A0AAF3EL37_9BILA
MIEFLLFSRLLGAHERGQQFVQRAVHQTSLQSLRDPDIPEVFGEWQCNGTVYFPVFYYAEVACPIIVTTFPFDKQICPIMVMSLAFDAKHISMSAQVDPFMRAYASEEGSAAMQKLLPEEFSRLTKEMTTWGNGEWDVTNITTINVNQGGSEYIGYVLSIRRVPNFYVYVIALPCFILTALSVVRAC